MLCWCCFRERFKTFVGHFAKKKSYRHTWESAIEVKEIRLQDCGKTPKVRMLPVFKRRFLKIPKPVDSQFSIYHEDPFEKLYKSIDIIEDFVLQNIITRCTGVAIWKSGSHLISLSSPQLASKWRSISYAKSRLCVKVQQVSTSPCVWVNLVGLFGFYWWDFQNVLWWSLLADDHNNETDGLGTMGYLDNSCMVPFCWSTHHAGEI